MSAAIPMSFMVKLRGVLAKVLHAPADERPLSIGLWSEVNDVHAELHAFIEPALFAHKVDVAIERGPQIAADMCVQLPRSGT